MESCLENWTESTLKEFVETARTIEELRILEKEKREKLYLQFRKLYGAGIIGPEAQIELTLFKVEAVYGEIGLSEGFQQRSEEKLEQYQPKEIQPRNNPDQEKPGPLSLEYLMDLASSYLITVSRYVLTTMETRNITPQELIKAIRLTYDKEVHDGDDLFILEITEDLINEFNNSREGTGFSGKGFYEFVDFCQYLHYLKKRE